MRRNTTKVVEVDGLQVTAHEGKVAALTSFYKGILGEPGDSSFSFDLGTLNLGQKLASDRLTAEFSTEEALLAVRSMNSNSAPGPDGFGPSFYGAAWDTIKDDVMALLHGFFDGSVQLDRVNRSYMVLLPKKPGAVSVDAFRPICLQNCSVEIAAKILTTRMQQEISELIDKDQTGFLKGRTIAENFVYAAEILQLCHKRRAPTLVLKLDFAKAFDTVNWDCLMKVMAARGFSEQWRSWVHMLLATSRTAVLVNGSPGPWFSCK